MRMVKKMLKLSNLFSMYGWSHSFIIDDDNVDYLDASIKFFQRDVRLNFVEGCDIELVVEGKIIESCIFDGSVPLQDDIIPFIEKYLK